jgi:hypothetical protein
MNPKRIDALLLESSDPEALTRFYRERLRAPFEDERHGSKLHWTCFLGGIDFAIHQREGLARAPRNGSLSFDVTDIDFAIA